MSVEKEFHSDVWRYFPRKFMLKMANPVWGKGTATNQSRWCFSRQVPFITEALCQRGNFEYEGFFLRFGTSEIFIHKIQFTRR